jgi:hypothetical protein
LASHEGLARALCVLIFFLSKTIYKNTAKNNATDSEREAIIEMHNLFLHFPTPKGQEQVQ